MVSNLALFCLATYLAAFQKMGYFFQIIWSPCQQPQHLGDWVLLIKRFLVRTYSRFFVS